MYQTLADGIKNRDRCPNCNGKGKVKLIDCPIFLATGNIKGVKGEEKD